MFRYEHSKLSDEKIAELVRESLAAVGLKVNDAYIEVKSLRTTRMIQLSVLHTLYRCGAHFRSFYCDRMLKSGYPQSYLEV